VDLAGFAAIFAVLLGAFLAYSWWARVDPRYPMLGALGGFGVAIVAENFGYRDAANTLALFVFLTAAGGVALMLLTSFRRPAAARDPGDAAPEGVDQG